MKKHSVREKKKKINAIISAAEKIFFEKGFHRATIEEIAALAGMAKGTIYNYFSSKSELCLAICHTIMRRLKNRFLRISESKQTGLVCLLELIDDNYRYFKRYPKHFQVIQTFAMHRNECDSSREMFREMQNEIDAINSIFVQVIKEGQKDGSISKRYGAEILAATLWGNVTGILIRQPIVTLKKEKNFAFLPDDIQATVRLLFSTALPAG
ncbi:MAG: TetR/AcrR family transcriptional regulator [Candidatus Cloacimonetes bacterium]|nr:TetR/AcrR family transcriptional regulator [Candidatus Cloacimonadota bacterium]